MTGEHLRVGVDVATMWSSPEAPREVDAVAVADQPDHAAWLKAMTVADRLDLHDRTLTQLLAGEPVQLLEDRGDWARVAAVWQPALDSDIGYPGWVRRAHLRPANGDDVVAPEAPDEPDRMDIAAAARRHLGLHYLWGGTSPAGLDCSGLVHLSYRDAGVVVPRDADAQLAAASPVALGHEEPGDLYFFGDSTTQITHVGFVTGRRTMLHAPEDAAQPGTGVIEEGPLSPRLVLRLVAVGRFLD